MTTQLRQAQEKVLDHEIIVNNKLDARLNVQLAIYDKLNGQFLGLENASLPVNYPELMVTLAQKYNTIISVHVNFVDSYSILSFNNLQELNDLAYAIDRLAMTYTLSKAVFEKLLKVRWQLDQKEGKNEIDTIKLAFSMRYPIKLAGSRVFIGFKIAKNKAIGANAKLVNNRLVLD